jgi:hypothetical protein
MLLNLSTTFEIAFIGRKQNESGPERPMTVISIAADASDAELDARRRFDVWLIQSITRR